MESTGQGMGKENTDDVPDALGSNPTSASTSSKGTSSSDFPSRKYKPKMDTCRPGAEYNMKNKHRGKAIIFNHEFFDEDPEEKRRRKGTQKDCTDLQRVLTKLGFDVEVCQDFSCDAIKSTAETVANQDHKDNDCLLVVILSHGRTGFISAWDHDYELDSIWSLFTTQKCPSLAGKPKLFFVQACQGGRLDDGITLQHIEYDAGLTTEYNIPLHPDFLIAYSTVLGFLAWRHTENGSWFIQALCNELEANGTRLDILTLLTFVNQRVALDYESNTKKNPENDGKKMMPSFISMLTRILIFSEKPSIGAEQVP